MDQSRDASLLSRDEAAYIVNGALENQRVRTRGGVRAWKLDVEGCAQGARVFAPAKGLSQQVFSDSGECIILASGGRRYSIAIPPAGGSGKPGVQDITGDGLSYPSGLQLVWLWQAESYAMAQDGESNLWIYDGATAFESEGLDLENKESSQLVNGATAGIYAHGRVVQSILNRIYIGDIIHKTNRYEPSNILEMTEQVYFETGGFFSAPSNLGPIIALDIIPVRDTTTGQGGITAHTKEGIFTLDIAQQPRSSWPNLRIVNHLVLGTAATGPYAIAGYDGDQIFRSRHGLQSIRLARAEASMVGNPVKTLSEGVRHLMERDHAPFLRFASVARWQDRRRLMATVSHRSLPNGARGAMGIATLNFRPIPDIDTEPAWEGLTTLPSEVAMVSQLLSGVFNGRERVFAICSSAKGEGVWLVEFTEDQIWDEVDGKRIAIQSQVVSQEFSAGNELSKKAFETGTLFFRDVVGDLDWEVWVKTERVSDWERWRSGSQSCGDPGTCCGLDCKEVTHLEAGLGAIPDAAASARKIQFLVKWAGRASLEGLRLVHSSDKTGEGGLDVETSPCKETIRCSNFNPWEYSHV